MRLFMVETTAGDLDVVVDRCWQAGAAGIWERAPFAGTIELRVGVEDADADSFCAALDDLDPDDVTDREAVELATRRVVVDGMQLVVPPAVFGDGAHPTTRTCAELLTRVVGPDDRVLDVGCGVGVLSLVSASRGAEVVAIDIDLIAVETTRANAASNGLEIDARCETLDQVDGRFEVVVANLSAGTLVDLADHLLRRTTRDLLVSGILPDRWAEVRTRLALPVAEERDDEGWVTARLAVRPAGA